MRRGLHRVRRRLAEPRSEQHREHRDDPCRRRVNRRSRRAFVDFFGLFAQVEREQYEPYQWQVTDVGLAEDAVKVCTR
ncbi:hypothetical protein ACFWBH_01150 [Streptomyces sp. NPDC059999]|uniref:hypothetical protein n=1 Tax=Streptomyces sp. NPDC059999 TaxID=3347030 RepID=UPI00368E66E3